MEHRQLPPELQQLERDLTARPLPEPPADLRRRVIGQVRAGVRQERSAARWAFAAALAAAVLVWVNLSLSATQATDYGMRLGGQGPPIGMAARQIQRLLPGISRREALRQATLLQAGSNLVACPDFPARPDARNHLDTLGRLLAEGE